MNKRTNNAHGPHRVTPAGRSVLYDLGFDEAEARILEMRADLMAALRDNHCQLIVYKPLNGYTDPSYRPRPAA